MKSDFNYDVFEDYVDGKINKVFSEELNPALEKHYKLGYKHGLKEKKLRDKVIYFSLGLIVSIILYLVMAVFIII